MLELDNVSFKVNGENKELEIIDNISLKIEKGKFIVITGPNGSGKSTFARLIMGIEKPTSGRIIFEGTDITDMPVSKRAKLGIGYAFQHPARFKGMTVRRLLSLSVGYELPERECCEYLTKVGLCSLDYLNREVDSSLSGGELKRIEIATLMARKLKLAIYDEPEAGIDLWSFTMLVDSFRKIGGENSEGVIIISHQDRILQLADEIILLADGKIKKTGERDDILPELINEFDDDCGFTARKV